MAQPAAWVPLTLELRSYGSEQQVHQHDYHQLVLPVSGSLSMTVGTRAGEAVEGRLAVIAAGQEHGYCAEQDNCFLVADLPAGLAPALELLPAFVDLDPALAHYVGFLYQQFGQAPVSAATQRQMLLLLIDLLLERFQPPQSLDRRVAVARQFLDDHLQQPVAMAQLAKAAHLSPRQLGELFTQQLGMTPQQYLIEKRMRHAWQLLTDTPLPVQQVAERVGYSSLSAFSRRFSAHFGRSPRHFR